MKTVFSFLACIVLFGGFSAAQDTVPGSSVKLTHEMSPDELRRKAEIGRTFIETPPPAGPLRNVEEFGRMQGALVRYPFGIPVSLIREMADGVMVTTIVANLSQKTAVTGIYVSNGVDTNHCNFLIAPSDSYWTRDYGPWFESDSSNHIGIVDFPYNRPRPNDDEIPKKVAEMLGIQWYGMNLISTGGDYMTDGMGNSASTELVWTENPSLTHDQVAQKVLDYLGVENYQVVPDPNVNTSIDHIDCWGKFLAPDKILIRQVGVSNPCYNALETTATYWASQTSPYGTNYRVYRVQTPSDQPYSNSVILNNKVLIPFMNSTWDDSAKAAYEAAMPGYTVVGFPAQASTPWLSTDALHCRVMGLADIHLLYVKHIPVASVQPCDENYIINAGIISCSDSALFADSVLVYYKVNNGSFQAVHMTNISGNLYRGIIPRQAAGSTVKYYIYAADRSGRRETAPFIGNADPFTFSSVCSNVVAVPDTLWFNTPYDAMYGKVTYLHNFTASAVDISYLEMNGSGLPWHVDSTDVSPVPYTLNAGDSAYVRVRLYMITDHIPGLYLIDSVNYTTNLGTGRFILMVNPQILGGIRADQTQSISAANFPNPFISATTINFSLREVGNIRLGIFDLNGQLISEPVSGAYPAGEHSVIWDGTDRTGNKAAAGIYLYRLTSEKETLVKRMLLIR
ncbi:MAG: agmatine deiminase family protein [Bacteroidales bacterium]